jgi:hypothetical protein
MNGPEVIAALQQGKKVSHKQWQGRYYFYYVSANAQILDERGEAYDWLPYYSLADNWELYEPKTYFKNLKTGDKFITRSALGEWDTHRVYRKVVLSRKYAYLDEASSLVLEIGGDVEVKKV